MRKRILSAVVLVPILLIILFAAPKIVTTIVVSFICAVAAFELLYNTGLVRHPRMILYSMIIAAMIPLWSHFGELRIWAQLGIFFYFVLLFLEMMAAHMKLHFEKVCVCFTGGILIPYLLSSLVRIMIADTGRYVILVPFIVAFMQDSGAYFVGIFFGRHKMAPIISPKKSFEGLAGGVATAVLSMLIYAAIVQIFFSQYVNVNYGYAVVYGFIGAFAGVFGDLCCSVIKRQTGIKDFGNLIPGHGGVLDRFDSVLVAAPLVETLLVLLPIITR